MARATVLTSVVGLAAVAGLAQVSAGAIALTGVTLAGPAQIPCGGSATYTLTVTGTGTDSPVLFNWSVWDDDVIVDDPLVSITPVTNVPPVNANGWQRVVEFTLSCSPDCGLYGPGGVSGESEAEVYAEVRNFLGFALIGGRSNTLVVECVIPAPGSVGLVALGGLMMVPRRRH